jgi:nitrogenase molybdenum-iron protein alpha/beta subunit
MARDVNYNAIAQYYGTLKDFNSHLCKKKCDGEGKCDGGEKHAKNKPVCDLSSCPIDGAYLTLSKIGSLVILFHSPPGCSTGLWMLWGGAYSLKSVTGTKKVSECITLCTNMNESDVVYGGTEKLRRAVQDVKERFNPEHTVILSSCCPGIIGDDFNEVVEEARSKYNMNIGWLDTSGFKSWYWPNGYDLAHQYIVDHIMEQPLEVLQDTVNIITYGNAASADERECGRLLTQLGLNVQYPLSVPHTTIENIKQAPYAKANAMMCLTYGWNFCQKMKEVFGTEYSNESHPIGTYFTNKWIMGVAQIFGKEKEAQELIEKELQEIDSDLKFLKEQLNGKTIAISAGHDKAPSLLAMAFELGLKVCYVGLVTYDDLVKEKIREVSEMFNYDVELYVFPQTYEEIPLVKKYDPDVFIGPAGLTPKNVMMQIPAVSTHFNDFIGPYFGYKGLVNFGTEILNAVNDPMPRYAPFEFLITGRDRVCGEEWYKNFKKREDMNEII